LKVNVISKPKVIPGGQSIGVKLNTKGVLIVGLEEIEAVDGKRYNPGHEAGLMIGDSIMEINDIKVRDAEHVTNIINENKGIPINIKGKRHDRVFNVKVTPAQCKDDHEYRIGLWVRDKTAGVGDVDILSS
jgi:stage IV sporulation protein B